MAKKAIVEKPEDVSSEVENEEVKEEVNESAQVVEQQVEEKPVPEKKQPIETAVNNPQKMVRIHTTENVHAIVAQISYDFPKDKDVSVPSDVAAILTHARKAYRL